MRAWVDSSNSGNLHIKYISTGDEVVVNGYTPGGGATNVPNYISKVIFEGDALDLNDDVIWDLTQGLILNDTDDAHSSYGSILDDVIDGRGGDDSLWGMEGDDIIIGGDGNDVLHGGDGDDLLTGSFGDDNLYGEQGNDTYEWSVGDGNDTIHESSSGIDQLILHGIEESDVRIEKSGSDMYLHINSESIKINNQLWADSNLTSPDNTRYEVETLKFDDGTVVDITENLTFTGSDVADYMLGTSMHDTFIGGIGNDVFYGYDGNDRYVWSVGDGSDTIHEAGGIDQLVLHGVQTSEVSYTRVSSYLDIQIGNSVIKVNNHFLSQNDYSLENIVFDDGTVIDLQILLNTAPAAQDDDFIGDQDLLLNGNVLVNNGSGADSDPEGNVLSVTAGTYSSVHGSVIVSVNGDFTYTPDASYNGADSFIYTIDDGFGGSDTATVNITVRPPNIAPIAQDDAFIGDQDISITGNVLLDNGSGSDTDPDNDPLTVVAGTYATTNGSVVIASNGSFTYTPNGGYVGSDVFTYTLQDDRGGNDIGTANITVNALANNPNAINGTSSNDTLNGDLSGTSNDTLIGYGGNDTLNGKLGNDSYDWSAGDGNDIINETGGVDQLVLQSVVAADIRIEKYGNFDLRVHVGSEYITVDNQYRSDYYQNTSYDQYQVESILLDDGSTIDLLNNLTLVGTAANDTLDGFNAATIFIGEIGSDTLNGKAYNDTYAWSLGDGNDIINETGGVDQFVLQGVIASDIRIEKYGNFDLRVHIGSEYITVKNQYRSDYYQNTSYDQYQVESVLLDDGSTIDLLNNLSFAGTSGDDIIGGMNSDDFLLGFAGNDTLNANSGNDTLTGGAGEDTLNGGSGSDGYVWSLGDGNDIINETGGVDQLVLQGVVAIDIRIEKYGNFDLRVHIGSEYITVKNQYRSDYYQNTSYDQYQVESVLLDDGSTIDLLNNLSFAGTSGDDIIGGMNSDDFLLGFAGNDTLNANSGNDTLTGGAGEDTLNGGSGSDGYVWSLGDGNDIINETGGVDQLVLQGVVAIDIRIEKYGNFDLRVHVGSEYITVDNQYRSDYYQNTSYDQYQLESILLDDGSTIDLINYLTLVGTTTNETLDGFNVATTFIGETGADTLNGKLGNDTYGWSLGDGNDIINETGGVDQLVLQGVVAADIRIEKYGNFDLRVHVGSEYITIDNQYRSDYYQNTSYDQYQVESIFLDDGSTIDLLNNLTFTGTAGNETINGLNANDILSGLDGDDTLNGNNGNDALHGGDGSDYLYGGSGDDVLYGGAGVDMLYGQSGADTFVFESSSALSASDNIQDFNLAEGDKLDVSDLLSGYDPLTDAISDFVQITESGSSSYLSVDADGGADNFVQVTYLYNATGLIDEEALETSGNLIAA